MVRVHITDPICLETTQGVLVQRGLPGPQGSLILAVLVLERHRGISGEELASELWGEIRPPGWEGTLRSLLSKLRNSMETVGLERETLGQAFGYYQLRLPGPVWVDVQVATDAVHRAEAAVRRSEIEDGCGWALVANVIGKRAFLPWADGPLVTRWRSVLRDVRVRALDCLAQVWTVTGHPELAARDAAMAIDLEPFREASYRLLMQAQVSAGNQAEALRTYQRCRELLKEELGVSPSPETEQVYLDILGA